MGDFITPDDARLLVALSVMPILLRFTTQQGERRGVIDPLSSLAIDYETRVMMFSINVDQPCEVARQHNVRDLPTFVLLRGGKTVASLAGDATRGSLLAFLDTHIGTA